MRTPLVRLELGPGFPDIRLKLENLQPINAYKLRGAANAVAMLPEAERKRGVWTISAGNAGQGVAYAARKAGVPCTVVAIETAPAVEARADEGARRETRPGAVRRRVEGARGAFVSRSRRHVRASVRRSQFHRRPRDDGSGDPRRRARHGRGHCRHRRRRAHHRRRQRDQGAQAGDQGLGRRTGDRRAAALSFAMGSPQVFKDWKPSFVDGAGGQSVFPRMWERMKPLVDGYIVVSLEETRNAMRLMAEKARVIAEGAGALPLAAALTGKAGQGPIVAIVSGGNIDLKKFCELIGSG